MSGVSRGQSEVLGVVLLLGMTAIVVGSTVAIGSVALSDTQSTAELQKADAAMTQVDSKASLVAHGDSTSRNVRLGTDGGVSVVDDGEMRIDVEFDDDGPDEINVSLRTVVYEHDGTTVAYQGGGVWRSDGAGSEMVSPPEFHYRGETLTLPLVTLSGDGHVGDDLRLSAEGEPDRVFPTENHSNPLVGGNVTITVESEYHEAWGRFFEERTDAEVSEVGENEVAVELPTTADGSAVSESVVGMNTRTAIDLAEVDRLFAEAYDSSDGPPDDSAREGIRVHATDGVDGTSTGQIEEIVIRGDLLTAGAMTPDEQGVESAGDLNVTGEVLENEPIPEIQDMSGEIGVRHDTFDEAKPESFDKKIEGFDDDTNVTESTLVKGDALLEGGTATLQANEETYVEIEEDLAVRGANESAELVVDTNQETDELHLSVGDVDVVGGEHPAEITVEGDGTLYVYSDGDVTFDGTDAAARMTVTDDAHVRWFHQGGTVEVASGDEAAETGELLVADDRDASQLWFVTSSDDVRATGGGEPAYLNGVVYAANGGDATVTVDGLATVDGALVADDNDLSTANLTLRYDEALGSGDVDDPFEGQRISTINHLHVSIQEVIVESNR